MPGISHCTTNSQVRKPGTIAARQFGRQDPTGSTKEATATTWLSGRSNHDGCPAIAATRGTSWRMDLDRTAARAGNPGCRRGARLPAARTRLRPASTAASREPVASHAGRDAVSSHSPRDQHAVSVRAGRPSILVGPARTRCRCRFRRGWPASLPLGYVGRGCRFRGHRANQVFVACTSAAGRVVARDGDARRLVAAHRVSAGRHGGRRLVCSAGRSRQAGSFARRRGGEG